LSERTKITLSQSEINLIEKIQRSPDYTDTEKMKSRVLLTIHKRNMRLIQATDYQIASSEYISHDTMTQLKKKYLQTHSILKTIQRKKRSEGKGRTRLSPDIKRKIIRIAQSSKPAGKKRWTYRTIAEFYNNTEPFQRISHTTVMHVLREENIHLK